VTKWAWPVGGVAAVVMLYLFRGLLFPLFLGAALAYLLSPLVAWAENFAVRRTVAVAAVYAGISALVLVSMLVLGPRFGGEVATLVERLPAFADRVDAAADRAVAELLVMVPATRRLLPAGGFHGGFTERLLEGRAFSPGDLFEHAGYLFLLLILVPFFAFFMLRETRWLTAYVMDRLPPAHVETSVAVWCEIDSIIGRYLRGVALDALAIGVLAAVGLWAIGVPYPLLLGVLAGLANCVPFIGPLLSAVAATIVVLAQNQGLAGAGRVVALFLVLKALDDSVIQPLTIGRNLHLHPMLLLASVVAGNQAFGILGMILAVPVVTVLQETVRLLLEHRRVLAGHALPPDEPPRTPLVLV
jgi:predicted PurR-regulated permease PerM